VGNHSAGRKVRAPGRHRLLNRAFEALVILSIVAIAAYAGWISFTPTSAPGSVLNPPVHAGIPSRPAERGVPPVPAALLSGATATPTEKAPMTPSTRTAHGRS